MRNPTRMAVAMHEAGHAVMRLIDPNAPPVAGIYLDSARGDFGYVDTQHQWHPGHMDGTASDHSTADEWRRFARSDVMFFLAGPVAEMRWRRYSRLWIQLGAETMAERCLGPSSPEFGSDLDHVRRRLRWSDAGSERQAFNAAWFATERTVARWIKAIRQLAQLLLTTGELGDDDISEFRHLFIDPMRSDLE